MTKSSDGLLKEMENLLSRLDKIDPSDAKVKEEYQKVKQDLTRQALESLKDRIPQKILFFNNFVNVNAEPGKLLHTNDLDRESFKYKCKQGGEVQSEVQVQVQHENRRKRAKTKSDVLEGDGKKDSSDISHIITGATQEDRKIMMDDKLVYTHYVPSHKQISEELEKIKGYATELVEIIGGVKLWIQLNVPKIEDGNNFGVGIQEDVIQELARAEESAFTLCDSIVKYYMSRAKLSSKVLKYPNVYDYQEAIRELDEKEWIHIKITLLDMRNNYILLYDMLCKNWEKVVKPKNEDAHHRMTF